MPSVYQDTTFDRLGHCVMIYRHGGGVVTFRCGGDVQVQ